MGTLEHNPADLAKQKETPLEGDAKILYEAYLAFSKGGMTQKKEQKLQKIDEVLEDASIQITKGGGAIITDRNGKTTVLNSR